MSKQFSVNLVVSRIIKILIGTFKKGVGSVRDATAVGPIVQTPLSKLEEGNSNVLIDTYT